MTNILVSQSDVLRKPVTAIKESEKDQIKKAIDTWGKLAKEQHSHKSVNFIVERDKLLVEWLFNTGMRISDALSIKFRDVDMKHEGVRFIVKKRSRIKPFIHSIALDKSILFEVQRFKDAFLLKDDERIFDLTRSTVDSNLKKYCKIAGLPKFSAHKYRHGCAMKDLEDGLPDFITAFRLAHSSTAITNSTYRRMTPEIERKFREKQI
jgi:integrase